MNTRRISRVVVGIDDTVAGLRALRQAVAEARRRGVELHAVRVWSVGYLGSYGVAYLKTDLAELAAEAVTRSFAMALGGAPRDVKVMVALLEGDPATVLTRYADADDDLLVVGCPRRSLLRRLSGLSTARQCVAQAACPVLAVPPTAFAREERQMARVIRRDPEVLAHNVDVSSQ
jgi:nucleotide-binding universal stress UspA family protein